MWTQAESDVDPRFLEQVPVSETGQSRAHLRLGAGTAAPCGLPHSQGHSGCGHLTGQASQACWVSPSIFSDREITRWTWCGLCDPYGISIWLSWLRPDQPRAPHCTGWALGLSPSSLGDQRAVITGRADPAFSPHFLPSAVCLCSPESVSFAAVSEHSEL